MNYPHPSRRLGFSSAVAFTLIELLVTISIIVFLAVLLMPTLGMGTTMANRTKCLNNLRQIQAACITYAGDNNGQFPSADRAFGFPHEFDNFTQTLQPYLQISRDKIMFCPGLIKARNAKTPLYDTYYTTYQYFNFPAPFLGVFSTNKPDLSRTVTAPVNVPLWGCLTAAKQGITYAHSEPAVKKPFTGMNAVYPDGHANWVVSADLENYYIADGLSLYWPKPTPIP